MLYRVEIFPRPRRQLDKIRGQDFDRIRDAILNLKENPRPWGVKKLDDDLFRIRVGDWRVMYTISDEDKLISVHHIFRRSESTYKVL